MKTTPDLDRGTTERMLAGLVEPDDAPPGYADVARVFQAAASPAERTSEAREAWAIAVAHDIIEEERTLRSERTARSSVRSRYNRAKVVGVLTVGTLLGTSGMAMAGVLPAPAQDAAAKVFDKLGITIPAGHPASTGSTISGIATTTTSTGVDKGQEISTIASGGKSQAGLHGKSSNPNVTTPNGGGTGTSDGASSGASDHGASAASTDSGGHSAAGSGNGSSHVPTP